MVPLLGKSLVGIVGLKAVKQVMKFIAGKVKCAKYWPEKVETTETYDGVTVTNILEKQNKDYILRQFLAKKG